MLTLKIISSNSSVTKGKGLLLNSGGPEETRKLGRLIGRLLQEGDVVALYGDLGSGKTCLIQGIAIGLGVKEKYITSPSFIMINEYMGRIPFYHIDLYRVGPGELEGLGLREYISSEGVTVIEWAERAESELPEERLSVYLKITGKKTREIRFEANGERYIDLIDLLKGRIQK
jgi:tRNA threonylcarbamoyladenosine biosynthesis protein TsaE